MSGYPSAAFPPDPIGVLASYFADGQGPTHTRIASAVLAAGIPDGGEGYSNKEERVRAAFAAAKGEQSYRLAEELLSLLRNDDAFGMWPAKHAWAKRARAAFSRLGWSIDSDGYPDWKQDSSGALPPEQRARKLASQDFPKSPLAALAASAIPPRPSDPGEVRGTPEVATPPTTPPNIFLVHGHDETARNEVESFVTRATGIIPTVLMLEASSGLTVIEKFEKFADKSGYAIVLMTADDVGQARADAEWDVPPKQRARQNVVFEFGYFVGYLRRSHVAALVAPGVERPSDIAGVVYIEFVAGSSEWKEILRREMREAGIPITG